MNKNKSMTINEQNCSGLLQKVIKDIQEIGIKNCKYMPSLSNMPHMEPRLYQIYYDTYLATLFGFFNISIVMQGILLECLLKEIIFEKEKKEFSEAYGSALKHCKNKAYISNEEFKFLNYFREKIRNRYQHVDIKEITKNSYANVYVIPVDKNQPADSIVEGVVNVISGKSEPPKKMTPMQMRPLGDIMKIKIDEEIYTELFLYVDYYVRKMCRKNFPI